MIKVYIEQISSDFFFFQQSYQAGTGVSEVRFFQNYPDVMTVT